jgi:hypothetical protein
MRNPEGLLNANKKQIKTMKNLSLIILSPLFWLAACNKQADKIKSFIPGTYVNSAKGDYAQAEDTLVITQVNDNTFLVTRNTTYQAIRDGRLLPKHHQSRKLNGLYDTQNQVLDETTNGQIFRFDPAMRLLKVNQAVYTKIN